MLPMNLFSKGLLHSINRPSFPKELKWELALEFSSIGVWEFDAKLNRVFFSEGSKQIIGVTNTDFGKNPQDWNNRVHPEDKLKYFQDFQDHLNGYVPMYENEHRILCEDGTYKWIRDRGKIVERTRTGKCKRVIGTHTDITKLKTSDTKINEALNIATKQNNTLKNFAHIVTHNLKQHSANFESILDLYSTAESLAEKRELMAHLKLLSRSFSKTISNLNDVVCVQTSKNKKIEKIYLKKEVDAILKMLDMVIKKSKATIHNNISSKLYIYYNPSYFESIVQNLLTNALKYKHPDRDPIINIDCSFDHEKIELKVTDNGSGIDLKKFGNDIFNLYKTFHHNDDAEGVGLYLIKNQIENYGGSISVDSKVNEGTTFTITAKNTLESA